MNYKLNFEYLKHGLLGAVMFMISYHFSIEKKSTLTALVPAVPILGLYGLFITISNKNNIDNYLQKISIFISISLIFYLAVLFMYKKNKNIIIALSCGFLIWLIGGYLFIDNK